MNEPDSLNVLKNVLGMNEPKGVLVTEIFPDGPAEKEGIIEGNRFYIINGKDVKIGGDVIIKADNKTITNRNEFEKILVEKNIGDNLTLMIFRNGQIKEMNVTATSKPGLRYEDASTYTNPSNMTFSTYQNVDLGIEIKYPLNWDVIDYEKPNSVTFRSLIEHKDDVGREYLRVDTIDNSYDFLKSIDIVNITLAQTLGVTGYMQNLQINELPHNITFLNNTAAKAVVSYRDDKYGEVRILKIAIEKNDKIYLLTYYAQAKNYYNYFPTIEQMIGSFEILSILQYENFDMGIKMEYPSSWNKTENNDTYSVATFDAGKTIELSPIATHNNNELPTSIEIYASDPFLNPLAAQESFNRTIDFYKNIDQLPNVKLISSKYSNNKNNYSYNITYSYGDPIVGIVKKTHIIIQQNERIYLITQSGEQKKYEIDSQSINRTINSIEIFSPLFYSDRNLGILFSYPSNLKISSLDNGIMLSSRNFEPSLTFQVYKKDIHFSQAEDIKSNNEVKEIKTFLNTTLNIEVPANKTIFKNPYSKLGETQLVASFNNNIYRINYNGINVTTFENIIRSMKIIDPFPLESISSISYNSSSGFNIKYPSEWMIYNSSDYVEFFDPYSSASFSIVTYPLKENSHLYEYIETDIGDYSKMYRDFNLIETEPIKLANQSAYHLMFSVENNLFMSKYIISDVNKNLYILTYKNVNTEFFHYFKIIEKMIDTFEFSQNSKPIVYTGFKVGDMPNGIAVSEVTNRVYVANTESNTISVINGSNDEIITNIPVSSHPLAVAINPVKNILYVTHEVSGDLSVIDCKNHTVIEKLSINAKEPISIAVNPKTDMIYVVDSITHAVSVIDGSSYIKVANIVMNKGKYVDPSLEVAMGIAVDDYKNQIYVADPRTHNITVIDGKDNQILMNINPKVEIGRDGSPVDITINSLRGKAYFIQYLYDDIYRENMAEIIEIDLSSNALHRLSLNLTTNGLNTLTVHPFTNIIYATDSVLKKVYAINPSTGNHTSISVDYQPSYIAINRLTDYIYVSNSGANTISKINGNENVTSFGLKFFINPSNSVFILCDDGNSKDLKFSHQEFISYSNNVNLNCKARSENAFSPVISGYWSGLSNNNSGFKFRPVGSTFIGFDTLEDLSKLISQYWSGLWSKVDNNNPTININLNSYSVLSGTFTTLSTLIQILGPTLSIIILATIAFISSIPSIVNKVRKLHETSTEEIISRADIITINASVIAGVLVFLSILEGFKEDEQSQISFITATIVFPFAISAVLAITRRESFALRLMIAGFINLMISVTLIALMRL